ncbi:hypothetical protein B1748_19635 [Paenibacillus sp. MY03]|nr:hypothetical protein B1748_19635 [Paenibacillus sp. MY03]
MEEITLIEKGSVFTASEHNVREGFPFAISHWIHDADKEILWHSHEFIEIVFIVDGSTTHVFQAPNSNKFESKVSKGDIFIINPGELHTYKIVKDERIEVINMLFYSNIVDWTLIRDAEEMDLMDFFYVQPFLPPEARFGNVLKLNKEEAVFARQMVENLAYEYKNKKNNDKLLIKLIMTQLIVVLSRMFAEQMTVYSSLGLVKTLKIENIHRVLGYLERHYSEDISLEQLAKISISSERQMTRIFKSITGETIFGYLHKLRIEKAKSLLLVTDNKISDICTAVGFNDISFFNKVFKKIVGVSPKDYRTSKAQTGSIKNEFISTLDMGR